MKTIDDLIIFNDDKEFTDYCLSPNLVISPEDVNGDIYYYHDYPYTNMYIDAVNSGKKFKISDPKSLINKRQRVCRGIITKIVDNLI